jgi:hypothetical protein
MDNSIIHGVLSRKNRRKPGKSFLSFLKSYKPKRALVFIEKEFGVKQIENTKVGCIPYYFI